MGRKEQKAREKKRAAATCHKLDSFLPKKTKTAQLLDEASESRSSTLDAQPSTSDAQPSTSDAQIDNVPLTVSTNPVSGEVSCYQDEGGGSNIVDIGEMYLRSETSNVFCDNVKALTTAQKYNFLCHHSKPPEDKTFPTQYLGGCNRSFRHKWLGKHKWMVYSEKVDGIFCMPCVLFAADPSKGQLVTKPFRVWNKKSEKVKTHETNCDYHDEAMEKATLLKQAVERPHTTIAAQVDARKAVNIQNNREVIKSIARAVLFCGRQCIALRGDKEDLNSPGNPGNFLALLRLMAVTDGVLQKHLQAPAMRNATCMSPQTQNELIEVMGKHMILKGILEEINAAPFYSIMADEVTSHNTELLAICARFVDSNNNIREDFLKFIQVDRITGRSIAEAILQFLRENGIPTRNMRGQGYDGASNMSSKSAGVQARIKEVAPQATYIHCNGHCLNLVISKSCALPQIRNVIDRLQDCCRYFLHSPKRSGALEKVINHNIGDETKRKPLLDLCKTRWAERHSAYQHFYQAYVFIVETLEMIAYSRHLDKYGDTYADWDTGNRSDAHQILKSITSYEFIVVFLVVYQYLSHLAGITVKLQGRAVDIVEAHEMVTEIQEIYKKEREEVEKGFGHIFEQSQRMAEKVGSAPEMPRIAVRQQHRANAMAASPREYYQRNVVIPFLDHITTSLSDRFAASAKIATSLIGLVPTIVCSRDVRLEDAVAQYEADLPSPELFPMELNRWKNHFMPDPPELRPASPAEAIKRCDTTMFPNIGVLLKIACTLPVTSCECERSFSALRRLNNYMRASMGKIRLSNLALLHIHYDTDIDLDKVVDCFAQLHPRRLELDNLL
ncbi:52 kDa repressor of the inhibitor of the protein kinase-like [Branchiostoma floridae]|uniref:52 kDa repressor of the inhibitor of the protein kinase-like n=1 Tax=Branchiostoma floridae TaxID=7739 RepID=A0A9J7KRA4_BRAFL|nr:52 kDa repressor of the inhibitor of the protein kinase-like [Branchiostoma floridae]